MSGTIEDGELFGAAKASLRRDSIELSKSLAPKNGMDMEKLLSSLLDNCGTEVFAINRNGRVPFLNAAAGSDSFKPDSGLWEIFPAPMAEVRAAAADEVFSSGNGGLLQIEAQLGERSILFEDRMTPFKGENGELEFVLVSCRNIESPPPGEDYTPSRTHGLSVKSCGWLENPKRTASKEKDKNGAVAKIRNYAAEIREREEERDAIGDGLDGVIVERLGKGLQLLWGNRELCNVSGLTLEELKGRRCYEAVRGIGKPCDGCTAIKALETSSVQEGEIKSPDGHSYKSKSTPLKDGKGIVNGVMHVAMDITQWRELDEKIKQTKLKAEELSRVKSEFLSCISHEIRTPLNAIVGMAELLKDVVQPGNKEVAECCTEIERASDMLLSILNDILDYSLLEAGSVKVFSQVFDLREEINSVSSVMERKALEKGLSYKLEIADDLPWSVCGDPRHLRRILLNLVGNAIKFTEHGRVGVRALRAASPSPGGDSIRTVRIEVEDTGIGIGMDSVERIFEPFTQEDSSSSRSYNGTGLGLAIVKKLVTVMGGLVELRSAKGIGSAFSVELPFKDGAVASAEAADAERSKALKESRETCTFSGIKALLLDASANAPLVRRILDTLGVETKHAKSYEDAAEMLKAGNYDTILFDAKLADGIGLKEFASLLKKNSHGYKMALLAMARSASGRGGADAVERDICHKAGIEGMLSKPPRRSQISTALKAHCVKTP